MKKSTALIIVAVSSVVVLALAAVLIFSFLGKGGGDKKPAKEDSGKEIRVTNVRSIPTLAVFGRYDYGAQNLLDNNLNTCWSVNLRKAAQEGHYTGNILEGLVFTLESPEIDSVLIWNGFTQTLELFNQNAAAGGITLIDRSNGSVLGEYPITNEFRPFTFVVNKKLGACSDGSYQVQVNFGSYGINGVRRGNRYDDFCVSEIHFWTGKNPKKMWPKGSKAVYDLKGPVRFMRNYDGVTKSFTRDGFENTGKFSYSPGTMVFSYTNSGARRENVKETYDNQGFLISKYVESFTHNWTYESFNYAYDYEGNMVRLTYNKASGRGEYLQTFKDGNKASSEHWITSGGGRYMSESWHYEVLNVDKYNNWTSRKVVETGVVQERYIEYYE